MNSRVKSLESATTERQLRLVLILDALGKMGLTPVPLLPLHTVAYFTDALAPVWNVPVMEGQVLKRETPYYPSLQMDLDRLVGCAVVLVTDVSYQRAGDDDRWFLSANYALNDRLARPILQAAESLRHFDHHLHFVREVVFAASGLGMEGLHRASTVDAAYSNPLVAVGGLIEVATEEDTNLTANTALRFGELLASDRRPISDGEMIHLYVRRLYERVAVA